MNKKILIAFAKKINGMHQEAKDRPQDAKAIHEQAAACERLVASIGAEFNPAFNAEIFHAACILQ